MTPRTDSARLRKLAMPALDMASLPGPHDIAPHIARLCQPGPQPQGQYVTANLHEPVA